MNEDAKSPPSQTDFEPDEPSSDPGLREVRPEIPAADAIDQHRAVDSNDVVDEPASLPADVPEADALDQARIVPVGEDSYDSESEWEG